MRRVDIDGLGAAVRGAHGVPDRPRVVVSGNFATPLTALAALDAAFGEYTINAINGQRGLPRRPGVRLETSFVGPGMRGSDQLVYVPSRLSLVPRLFATALPPDVVLVHTTVPHDGMLSLGIEVNVLVGAIEACRARGGIVVAQMNPQMPYTFGDGEFPEALFDIVVEVDEPLPSVEPSPPDEASLAIGERVAARVQDGATLQLGIGGVPDAVLLGLPERRGLRLWSEMFSDGVLFLDQKGALDERWPLTSSFTFGSEALYRWVHRNPRVRMLRTETTNEPALIGRNPLMVSVNTGLQVDLYGQVNAARMRNRIYSGFGGQTDFVVGALHSPGGQSIIALRSWHPKADVSTIVGLVDEPVTSMQPTAIVTEQGVAELFGSSQAEQARALIEHAAHPRVRAELWEEAAELGLT